jgi:hypothetical protein
MDVHGRKMPNVRTGVRPSGTVVAKIVKFGIWMLYLRLVKSCIKKGAQTNF